MTQQASAIGKAKICPVCRVDFERDVINCPADGILLTERDPLIGQVLDGRYEVIEFIGQGGMSLVYKARQSQLERFVAIKLLKPEYMTDAANIQRFRREAKAASFLQHPNINAIYAVGVTKQGQPYLVLEFLDGESLATIFAAQKPLDLQRALHMFVQVTDGLEQAHTRGVIHRDLKPSNVVIVQDADGLDVVKLVDFGTAKLATQMDGQQQKLTQAGEVLGTLLYMSPEQKMGLPVDARSDIYAVGYMLYEALEKECVVPDVVLPIVEKALKEEPSERYQSAGEMRDALDALVNHGKSQIVSAGKKSAAKSSSKKAEISSTHVSSPGRQRVILVGSAVIAMVLATGLLFFLLTPADRSMVKFEWLRHTNADPETVIGAADDWATQVLDSNRDFGMARTIYENEVIPRLKSVPFLVRAKVLFGLGRTYVLLNDNRGVADTDKLFIANAHDAKVAKDEEARRKTMINRARLGILANSTGPVSNTKLHEILDIAHTLEHKKFYDEADLAYSKALETSSQSPAYQEMQLAILRRYIEFCQRCGQSEKVFPLNERMAEIIERQGGFTPANVDVLIRQGEASEIAGNLPFARGTYTKALELLPNEHPLVGTVWARLGLVARKRARFDNSMYCLKLAAIRHAKQPLPPPVFAAVFTALGLNYRRFGDEENANSCFERVYNEMGDNLLLMPECVGFADGFTRSLFYTGHKKESLKFGRHALKVTDQQGLSKKLLMCNVAWMLSDQFRNQGQWDKAKQYGLKALELTTDGAERCRSCLALGDIALESGNPNEAQQYLEKAETMRGTGHSSYGSFVSIRTGLIKVAAAQRDLKKAKRLSDETAASLRGNLWKDDTRHLLLVCLDVDYQSKDFAHGEKLCEAAIAERTKNGLGATKETKDLQTWLAVARTMH